MKKIITSLPFQLVLGVAAAWTKAEQITGILEEFQKVVLAIVSRVVIPILPVFIGATFWTLSYEGTITKQLPVFIWIVADCYCRTVSAQPATLPGTAR